MSANIESKVQALEEVVDQCLERLGGHVVLGLPLGLGKPNRLVNAFYRRARADESIELEIVTALSLNPPQPGSDLERRMMEPFVERHFGADYPRLEYVDDRSAGKLPDNVTITEFYLQSGASLGEPDTQQNYVSSNYTHVPRDLIDRGINLVMQLVSRGTHRGRDRLSLSCNPDITLDLVRLLKDRPGHDCMAIGVVHPDLPFLHGDAVVDEGFFDLLVETPPKQPLFAMPRMPVSTLDYWVGLNASRLVADGGTLQIGIGSLSDALVDALILRQHHNGDYRGLVEPDEDDPARPLVEFMGGLEPMEEGLYGASEMFMDGFMNLYRAGILKRAVFNDPVLQELALEHGVPDRPDRKLLEAMIAEGRLGAGLDPAGLAHLKALGVLDSRVSLESGSIVAPSGERVKNELHQAAVVEFLAQHCLADALAPGSVMDGAFFLGTKDFYGWLNGLSDSERPMFRMTSVGQINQLYGGSESLEKAQRQKARFINTCMMMTATGAAVSDGLADHQVVSGVGGQYNFVAMAHAMEDGRSILMLRSTRSSKGKTVSNIVWEYPHTTIPRHLRDIVVTEYGIADLRGRTDAECIKALIGIADARFQDELRKKAVEAGKLEDDWVIPERAAANTPKNLEDRLAEARRAGYFPDFPCGSDFTEIERRLLPALKKLKAISNNKLALARAVFAGRPGDYPEELERLDLDSPENLTERLTARLVAWGLANSRALTV